MIKIEFASDGGESTVLCNICQGPIEHHSEGIGVFQGEGSLLRFHHARCAIGGFTERWPSVPLIEVFMRTANRLGICPTDWQSAPGNP